MSTAISKPDNVFVLGSTTGAVYDVDVRVVDFGAALVMGTNRVTKTGVVFGTPHYMSPEQASGQPVDHRADVYALGVILYEMFTGRVPFVADTYMGVLTQHMFVRPTPPSQLAEVARELGALEDVTLRALEKRPENRYATMQELAADIERASSFGEGGAFRANPKSPDGPRSRPVFPMADALEVRSRADANEASEARSVTWTSARKRRARARQWALYAGISLGVAMTTLAAIRAMQPAPEGAVAAPASLATTPATSITTTTAVTASVPAAEAPPPAPPATTLSRGPARPPRAAPSAKRPRPAEQANDTDFADPWAK